MHSLDNRRRIYLWEKWKKFFRNYHRVFLFLFTILAIIFTMFFNKKNRDLEKLRENLLELKREELLETKKVDLSMEQLEKEIWEKKKEKEKAFLFAPTQEPESQQSR